jgi:hypothetical protein
MALKKTLKQTPKQTFKTDIERQLAFLSKSGKNSSAGLASKELNIVSRV